MLTKDLTKISDLSRDELEALLRLAAAYKRKHDERIRRENVLDGKVVALVFEKPSLRTKVAFEVTTTYLGGTPVFLSSSQILASGQHQHGRESIPDIARNLERFVDLIVARVYFHGVIREISEAISIPVINALCDTHHPTQALADLMAIRSRFGTRKVTVSFIGDGNNVATSLLQACAMVGYDCRIATPVEYGIPTAEVAVAKEIARETKAQVETLTDPIQAVSNADVVYTDTWVSMGQEKETQERKEVFEPFRVNPALMAHATSSAVFMHCLPAHRGEEVTDSVIDSPQSIIFDQAECRLHVAKALIFQYLNENRP